MKSTQIVNHKSFQTSHREHNTPLWGIQSTYLSLESNCHTTCSRCMTRSVKARECPGYLADATTPSPSCCGLPSGHVETALQTELPRKILMGQAPPEHPIMVNQSELCFTEQKNVCGHPQVTGFEGICPNLAPDSPWREKSVKTSRFDI